MTIFNALNLIGGLCLFLFGMNLMGQALERRAGSGLRSLLEKMTQNRLMGRPALVLPPLFKAPRPLRLWLSVSSIPV